MRTNEIFKTKDKRNSLLNKIQTLNKLYNMNRIQN